MIIKELHVLDPVSGESQIPSSTSWIGLVKGKLFVKVDPFSFKHACVPYREFETYWLPPEMIIRKSRPFQSLITFDDKGKIEGLDYVLGDVTPHGGTEIIWMAGNNSAPILHRQPVQVVLSVTDRPPLQKCSVTFPVVTLWDKKFFALHDKWTTDEIPALDDFRVTEYLAGPLGSYNRWKETSMNVAVIRKGRVVTRGCVTSTGGMSSERVFHLPEFTDKDYSHWLNAERFKTGDRLRIQFVWYGKYPVLKRLQSHHLRVNLISPYI